MRWSWLGLVALVACSEGARAPVAAAPAASSSPAAVAPPADAGVPDAAPGDPADDAELVLAIPARSQAPEAPPSGWCGETAIQEGLLHLGVTRSQSAINKAGHPAHADLYATEIPRALTELGVKFTPYAGARGYEPYRAWVIKALEAGHPVLAGVKLVPSEHPSWGLDHFVLVVGHGRRGLLVNTTWGYRAWVSDDGASGLSFKGAFYGLRLDGVR
jgi:hypothetical protein